MELQSDSDARLVEAYTPVVEPDPEIEFERWRRGTRSISQSAH